MLLAVSWWSDWALIGAGKPYWEQAGVADRIDLRIAPAADSLRNLLEVRNGKFAVAWPAMLTG